MNDIQLEIKWNSLDHASHTAWYGVDLTVARRPWLRNCLPFDQNDITPLFEDEPWCTSTGRVRRVAADDYVVYKPGAVTPQFFLEWFKDLYATAGRSNPFVR